jgi:hypothetical protein
MGFVGYRVGLAFVHKGVVAESEHFSPWRHADFLEKGRSTDWVQQTHFVPMVDGVLRIDVAPQHEGSH